MWNTNTPTHAMRPPSESWPSMNIYFWKEDINHFQRVSTQIIRYINLLFTCLVTVTVARFNFLKFYFKSSVFLPTDWRLVAKCCTMNVSKSGQKYMIGYTCFSNSNMRRVRDAMAAAEYSKMQLEVVVILTAYGELQE